MTDQDPTPDQQTPGQQVAPEPATTPQVDWEARYKGSSQVINQLNDQIKTLKGQLDAKASENEQLNAQLALSGTEKTVAVSERDKQIQQLVEAGNQTSAELAELRALQAKVKVAQELNDPSLLKIFDSIPNVDNEETLRQLMSNISDWSTSQVKQREEELLAGVKPAPPSTPPVEETLPGSTKDWQAYINKFDLGTPEREKAFDKWRDWEIASRQS